MSATSGIWERVYRRKEEIFCRNIAGETILVPIRGRLADLQRIFFLNSVGESIWNELNGEKNLGQISEVIRSLYDVSKEEADSDLLGFVEELLKEDLIEGVR